MLSVTVLSCLLITMLKISATIAGSSVEECSDLCTREYAPICGQNEKGNKKRFLNECEMAYESCISKTSKNDHFFIMNKFK